MVTSVDVAAGQPLEEIGVAGAEAETAPPRAVAAPREPRRGSSAACSPRNRRRAAGRSARSPRPPRPRHGSASTARRVRWSCQTMALQIGAPSRGPRRRPSRPGWRAPPPRRRPRGRSGQRGHGHCASSSAASCSTQPGPRQDLPVAEGAEQAWPAVGLDAEGALVEVVPWSIATMSMVSSPRSRRRGRRRDKVGQVAGQANAALGQRAAPRDRQNTSPSAARVRRPSRAGAIRTPSAAVRAPGRARRSPTASTKRTGSAAHHRHAPLRRRQAPSEIVGDRLPAQRRPRAAAQPAVSTGRSTLPAAKSPGSASRQHWSIAGPPLAASSSAGSVEQRGLRHESAGEDHRVAGQLALGAARRPSARPTRSREASPASRPDAASRQPVSDRHAAGSAASARSAGRRATIRRGLLDHGDRPHAGVAQRQHRRERHEFACRR